MSDKISAFKELIEFNKYQKALDLLKDFPIFPFFVVQSGNGKSFVKPLKSKNLCKCDKID